MCLSTIADSCIAKGRAWIVWDKVIGMKNQTGELSKFHVQVICKYNIAGEEFK